MALQNEKPGAMSTPGPKQRTGFRRGSNWDSLYLGKL